MEWILASASPRRRELLKKLIENFEVIPASGEEVSHGRKGAELVRALAAQKAEEVAKLPEARGKAVLAADTIVCLDGETLGKPKDEKDAVRMLSALSGRTHEVWTGVCMLAPDRGGRRIKLCEAERTEVVFETLGKERIERYVATGSPMDKAGAYGIQDGGLVKKINGSFSNVVGLPVELCAAMLKSLSESLSESDAENTER